MDRLPREVVQAAHRFADQFYDQLRALPRDRHVIATVATVTPGGAADGVATLTTVTWRGAEYPAKGKNRDYAPVVGDRVKCSLIDDQLFIDYAIDGQP